MQWRPAAHSDVPALIDFVAAVESVWPASRELGWDTRLDRIAGPADSLVTVDPYGEIVGYADVIDLGIADGVQRIGLTVVSSPRMTTADRQEQLDRMISAGRELRRSAGPAVFGVRRALNDLRAHELLAQRGFTVVSELHTLRRATDRPIPVRPGGPSIVPYSAEFENASRVMHNEAFRDIPSAGQPDPARWRQLYVGTPAFLPELSYLAVEDGTVVGLLLTWADDNQVRIPVVGTAPDRQRRGIATALLAHAFEHYRRAGYTSVILEVDAGNTPAESLYARLGFVATPGGYAFYTRAL